MCAHDTRSVSYKSCEGNMYVGIIGTVYIHMHTSFLATEAIYVPSGA